MIVCLLRPQRGFKPVSAHFRTSGTTSGETFVVTDGPLKTANLGFFGVLRIKVHGSEINLTHFLGSYCNVL